MNIGGKNGMRAQSLLLQLTFRIPLLGMAINPLEHMCDLMCHDVRQKRG